MAITLKNLLFSICNIGLAQKCVNYADAGTSLYNALNGKKIENYPVLFVSPTGEHLIEKDTVTYAISLFYFDRLLMDNSNDIDVYSAAIEQLKHIVNGIGEIDDVIKVEDGYQITNFSDTESFDDYVGGAYTEIQVVCVNNEICYDL